MNKCLQANTVILVQYPFTDLSSSKVRPALILRDQLDDDIICLPITSEFGTTIYDKEIPKNVTQGFEFPIISFIRPQKIATLNKTLVRKTLGTLKSSFFLEVKRNCLDFLAQ